MIGIGNPMVQCRKYNGGQIKLAILNDILAQFLVVSTMKPQFLSRTNSKLRLLNTESLR